MGVCKQESNSSSSDCIDRKVAPAGKCGPSERAGTDTRSRLRELLANPAAINEARALLAELIEKFTLERVSENGEITCKANGQIDFFGEDAKLTATWIFAPEPC
jgi:hypothetical protein